MCIIDRFILTYFLRSHVAFSATIIVIVIYFLFFDNYISNLWTFLKRISIKETRWYYDHYLIFKFFFLFFVIMIKRYCRSSIFENVLLTIRLCITKNLIVNDIISFSAIREHVFYAIISYENDLINFSYNSQLFWCKQVSSERFATAARLIICI